ncbi:MAG TPA: helix-turn-helix domain-containing protein, partial [Rubrivivax sp.]|nr:helix-turn-helix domain-containing protein [Rubrivivax sp.]
LLNVIKRASIMADGARVSAEDLGLPVPGEEDAGGSATEDVNLRLVRERAERQAIVIALARTAGNIVRASEMLGVSRPTLYDLMHRLAIK